MAAFFAWLAAGLLRLDRLGTPRHVDLDPACIRHTDLPGSSKLFTDLCYGFGNVASYYRHDPGNPASYAEAARAVQYPMERRAAMARALAAQNPPSELLTRFAQPDTVAVITGQQVGLFSGPAYTIYKALTAARLAAELTARGVSAVPVFWLATEDHDFAEAAETWVFDEQRRPVRLSIAADHAGVRPAGTYEVKHPPVEQLRAALHTFPHAAEVIAAVEEAYCSGSTMGSAFRALLRKLLGSVGVLMLDPLHPEVREVGAPLLSEALRRMPELKQALLARCADLEKAGYHAQVVVEAKTSLCFLLEGGERVTLRLKDEEYAELADRAAQISPNALLRPVWQDYMLPTVAYIGGPGEIAYFAQSSALYEQLHVPMPVIAPRAFFTLTDARAEKLLRKFNLAWTNVFEGEEALRQHIARTLIPESLKARHGEARSAAEAALDALNRDLGAFDPTLGAAAETSRKKVLYQLDKLWRKAERETFRRDARASADAAYLTGLLYPERHLQERLYSILPFLALYGMDLVERLYEDLRTDCFDHRVLTL